MLPAPKHIPLNTSKEPKMYTPVGRNKPKLKNQHRLMSKYQFQSKYPSARYNGKHKLWIMSVADKLRYDKNPISEEDLAQLGWTIKSDGPEI